MAIIPRKVASALFSGLDNGQIKPGTLNLAEDEVLQFKADIGDQIYTHDHAGRLVNVFETYIAELKERYPRDEYIADLSKVIMSPAKLAALEGSVRKSRACVACGSKLKAGEAASFSNEGKTLCTACRNPEIYKCGSCHEYHPMHASFSDKRRCSKKVATPTNIDLPEGMEIPIPIDVPPPRRTTPNYLRAALEAQQREAEREIRGMIDQPTFWTTAPTTMQETMTLPTILRTTPPAWVEDEANDDNGDWADEDDEA